MSYKGIILAGGSGSRLYPLTAVTNKHLLPVFDKPMIFYPLTTLMLAGIRDVAIITNPGDLTQFQRLLGDGSRWGIRLTFLVQEAPEGLPQAFIIAKEFIGDSPVCLILGDNIFYGHGLPELLRAAVMKEEGATVAIQYVRQPERFGVVRLNPGGSAEEFVEKPSTWVSNFAVTGLYFYDNRVVEIAKTLKPSARGELEIVDVNNAFLELGAMNILHLGRGIMWLDAGVPESLATATQFVQTVETHQNVRIACPEEVAFRMGYITRDDLRLLAEPIAGSPYGQYLNALAQQPEVM